MRDEFRNSENWSKRFLPHYNADNKYQMLTYRLADSIPREAIQYLNKLESLGAPQATAGDDKKLKDIRKRKIIEETLDKGFGSCILQEDKAASIIIENWLHFDKERYDLIAYVVMPNHIHILIKVYPGNSLGKIIWSWKSYTSRRIFEIPELKKKYVDSYLNSNKGAVPSRATIERQKFLEPAAACGAPRKIPLWQREYWDRFIRNEEHYWKAINYIHSNPRKAGLVPSDTEWPYSSINGI